MSFFSTGQRQKKEEAQPRAGKSSIQGVRGISQDFHSRKPRSAQSPTVAVAADQEALFQLVSTKSDSPTDKSFFFIGQLTRVGWGTRLVSSLPLLFYSNLAGQLLGPLLMCEATYLRTEGKTRRSGLTNIGNCFQTRLTIRYV